MNTGHIDLEIIHPRDLDRELHMKSILFFNYSNAIWLILFEYVLNLLLTNLHILFQYNYNVQLTCKTVACFCPALHSYDHSDLEYPSEYDEFDEYERRRRYR